MGAGGRWVALPGTGARVDALSGGTQTAAVHREGPGRCPSAATRALDGQACHSEGPHLYCGPRIRVLHQDAADEVAHTLAGGGAGGETGALVGGAAACGWPAATGLPCAKGLPASTMLRPGKCPAVRPQPSGALRPRLRITTGLLGFTAVLAAVVWVRCRGMAPAC